MYATYICGHTLLIWIPCSYYGLYNCPNYQRQYRARPLRCSATCRAPVTSSSLLIDDEVFQELMENLQGNATPALDMVPVSREQSRQFSGSASNPTQHLQGNATSAYDMVSVSREQSRQFSGSASNPTQNLPPSASSAVSLVGQEDQFLRDGPGTSRASRREGDSAQGPSTAMRYSENERRSSQAWTDTPSSSNRSEYSP